MIREARYPAMKDHGRVLIVDDEASIRKTLHICLSQAGYHVIEACDGQEAITALDSGDNALMVDAIICDIRMPRIDGTDAIRHFRAQYPSIPIIVLTGPDRRNPIRSPLMRWRPWPVSHCTRLEKTNARRRARP